jgi:uncharacterized protein YbaA (DUF1428 family)
MSYVDGFVLSVPEDKFSEYQKMAATAGEIWRKHGALQYIEAVGDDLDIKDILPFPVMAGARPGETVVFAWIMYKSREHRDEVNKKVMDDPRIKEMCDPESMPFDCKRMAYGGFRVIVDS